MPSHDGHPWAARSVVHPAAIYHIEGEPHRRAEGLYDCMDAIGAHEILLENPDHNRPLWLASDGEIEQFLILAAQRIQDLKRDPRFKYMTIFKNQGETAGQEVEHPNSQLTATTFVPRRVLYELRASRDYFARKERCVFCDTLAQDKREGARVVELEDHFIATCPFASRVPYETWIMPLTHESSFEHHILSRASDIPSFCRLLRNTLKRILTITNSFHLVVHTVPNTYHKSELLDSWLTIEDDYHWHVEILPNIPQKARSYVLKEVYYSPVSPEVGANRLREALVV